MAAVQKMTAETVVPEKDPFEEKVRVYVPRVSGDDGDVFVGLGGRHWVIRRGVDVEVPAPVAAVLANADYAARVSELRLEAEQARFGASGAGGGR